MGLENLMCGARTGGRVSLAEARNKPHEARKLLEAGRNPIEAKRQAAIIEASQGSVRNS